MALQVALSDYAPKRGLQAGTPLPNSSSQGDRPNRYHIAASLLLHVLVLFGIFLLPATPPEEVIVPLVTLRLEESGAAGAAGGKAGGGGGGGHGSEASSAPTEEKTAEATKEATAEPPTPPAATPPEPTPPEPTPPTPTPPTTEASPLPPAPEALAPKPKPHPQPVVKPHAVKPAHPVHAKPVETPTPPVAAAVASEPPPGPANGQGPPTQTPQPGTAATGTANAGPGGAVGAGTGTAGAGQGAFGDGRSLGDDYLDRLRRHLAKFKHYPPEAVKLKQEGTALVEFVLARDGTVLEAHIQRSSGFPLLDQATLDMIRNASPVPPVPARFVGERVSIAIPTGFKIGLFDRLF
jgi:protein TonB